MSSAAEKLIDADAADRADLLAVAERADAAWLRCDAALQAARGDLNRARQAAKHAPRITDHIATELQRCEQIYVDARSAKDAVEISRGAAWHALDAHDTDAAASASLPRATHDGG